MASACYVEDMDARGCVSENDALRVSTQSAETRASKWCPDHLQTRRATIMMGELVGTQE